MATSILTLGKKSTTYSAPGTVLYGLSGDDLYFSHGNALHTNLGQRLTDVVELEGLNDRSH